MIIYENIRTGKGAPIRTSLESQGLGDVPHDATPLRIQQRADGTSSDPHDAILHVSHRSLSRRLQVLLEDRIRSLRRFDLREVIGLLDPLAKKSRKDRLGRRFVRVAPEAVVEFIADAQPSAELARELTEYCRARLSHVKCPRSVDFEPSLPRQPKGKLYKRVLQDRYRSAGRRKA
jgi:acyl-CoA synthetase (AMP-forming)/AMP-acid ligase II